jgi:nitroreductase
LKSAVLPLNRPAPCGPTAFNHACRTRRREPIVLQCDLRYREQRRCGFEISGMSQSTVELLLSRRSVKPEMLTEPGPNSAELDKILTAAARVPDHKKLVPWRFIVFEGTARRAFGDVLAAACQAEGREPPSPVRLEMERGRMLRAPTVIAAISRVVPHPGAPEWEQILSAGAACFSLCLAANALGYATCWITEWYAYSPRVRAALKLASNERVAGFIYIGKARERQPERERPELEAIVTRWHG